ncbi:UV-B-induced protein At3g17800, chloroplastic [Neltuma alba]|uniref:UV-B-induced protein At3g17800, chloroplastic n=1 Tax=Neltuma alba TaxID=207710 RepID=UPI0010A32A08|nr:UV-B-induced protein At3g17800, chloroplastic [Prosopis alba]
MENCLYHPSPTLVVPRLTHSLSLRPISRFICNLPRKPSLSGRFNGRSRPINVKASAGASPCEFSSLNSPLEPKSHVGKFLSGVLQNHRQMFHVAVAEELKLLVDDRDAAVARMALTAGSDEDMLHRRIAQMKEHECEIAVQDVMYLLIFYKFSEIRVPLIPKLSECTYNGRLEILPSKDWELESIYSLGILDLIREHVTSMTGLRAKSSVTESWATTEIQEFLLARIYVASILYGYFLKSISLRYHLERSLSVANRDDQRTALAIHDARAYEIKDVIFGHMGNIHSLGQGLIKQEEEIEDLKCYVMGFQPGLLERCAKLRSKEAVNLVESYSMALFGNEESCLVESNNVILTSYSSLKRLVLEAVAFGSFLWETEDYIDSVYKLRDN